MARDTAPLDPVAHLTEWIDAFAAEGRHVDALMLSLARDALDMNETLMAAITAHRFDTAHLVERYAAQGQTFRPRLADLHLYDAAGLDRVASASGAACEHESLAFTGGKSPMPYWPGCTACGVESRAAEGTKPQAADVPIAPRRRRSRRVG